MKEIYNIKVNNKKYYFMQLWGDCSDLGYLGSDREKGPVDNVYSVKPENINLLLDNKYLDLIRNTTPKQSPRYKNFEGDSNIEYDYNTVKILHNNPKERKYIEELERRIKVFNEFYSNLQINDSYFFTVNFNDEVVLQSSNTLKGNTFISIIDILNSYNILSKTIFVGLNKGSTLWASNMHLNNINEYIEKYNLKYIEIFENDLWNSQNSVEQFKKQFKNNIKTNCWTIDRGKLFKVTKCFGIISWLPNEEPARTQRKERVNRLFKQLNDLWPEIDILVIAQNWQDFKPGETKNNQIIKNYSSLGILGARKKLREEFLNLNYKYIIMFDDDAIIEYTDIKLAADYIKEIDKHPLGFAFLKGNNNKYNPYAAAQLNLCAISRGIYESEPMVDLNPQKGEAFEDCVFATLLHYKYPQYEFDIPSGLYHSQYLNKNEKAPSTWWKSAVKQGITNKLIDNTNRICKYISENKKLPKNLKEFLDKSGVYGFNNNGISKVVINTTAEPFTGLTEDWWKEDGL